MPQQVKNTDKVPEGRMALVDALRGLAALWVAAYHFYNAIVNLSERPKYDGVKIDVFAGGS
jgi:peptidoglycan/LPS O-acetylase OafA/YrhL